MPISSSIINCVTYCFPIDQGGACQPGGFRCCCRRCGPCCRCCPRRRRCRRAGQEGGRGGVGRRYGMVLIFSPRHIDSPLHHRASVSSTRRYLYARYHAMYRRTLKIRRGSRPYYCIDQSTSFELRRSECEKATEQRTTLTPAAMQAFDFGDMICELSQLMTHSNMATRVLAAPYEAVSVRRSTFTPARELVPFLIVCRCMIQSTPGL